MSPSASDARHSRLPVIGWREWLAIPQFGVAAIKAKIDTGARSSALHAHGLSFVERDGQELALFEIHPIQRKSSPSYPVEATVIDRRKVTSSGGHQEIRPVIAVEVEFMDRRWPIEVTLAKRDTMGFRMLLGRQAIRRRFVVDPGRSYLGGRPG
ncbi:MAG: ATP-dependent zinc protease [Acidimicrobiia bacterium]|nr:ATP-dependent zinc protease [Acidimicrobiia bacterium]